MWNVGRFLTLYRVVCRPVKLGNATIHRFYHVNSKWELRPVLSNWNHSLVATVAAPLFINMKMVLNGRQKCIITNCFCLYLFIYFCQFLFINNLPYQELSLFQDHHDKNIIFVCDLEFIWFLYSIKTRNQINFNFGI